MNKPKISIRVKLILLYSLTILIPVIIIAFVMPAYYVKIITTETEKLTNETLVGLTGNIQTYLDDLERVTIAPYTNNEVMFSLKLKARGLYSKVDDYTKYKADYTLYHTLPSLLVNLRKDILGTLLVSTDGSVYYNDSSSQLTETRNDYPYTEQDWYHEAVAANGRVAFVNVHPQDYLKLTTVPEVFSVARLIKDPDSKQTLAVIMADADTIILDKIVRQFSFNVNSIVTITDKDHRLIYTNTSLPQEVLNQFQKNPSDIVYKQHDYVPVSREIPTSSWKITVWLYKADLASKVHWMHLTGAAFAAGGVVLTFFLFFAYSRTLLTPFKEMISVMRQVQLGNMNKRFSVRGQDEIAQLGNVLNRMISQLDELITNEYLNKLKLRNAEFRALQSQIHPHFLYNTLNAFVGLNRKGEHALLERAILSLSGMLRYFLTSHDTCSLEEEFSSIRKYGELMSMRFSDRLEIIITLDPELAPIRIPKLLLQPLVENAIIHGVEPCEDPCRVEVSAERLPDIHNKETVVIRIADNGVGFDTSVQIDDQHIGLSNVKERLALAFPDKHEFQLDSSVGHGTTLTITISLNNEEQAT
ncbi:two-component system, sensor histidine kinase YesM [Paenibacillus sp. 1_12]|uniref:sensor histidine kinase n=1 Tax=Paenibacillus sp. 1_12 TaxID=1566278 RepID=UPI0008EB6A15|nr:sensor histidine kinase [Paenibacillus sp. 1_12]SFK98814.1 two-component system, sensor histidine kinase YesM [Paenibacillus sp. 1_12]